MENGRVISRWTWRKVYLGWLFLSVMCTLSKFRLSYRDGNQGMTVELRSYEEYLSLTASGHLFRLF